MATPATDPNILDARPVGGHYTGAQLTAHRDHYFSQGYTILRGALEEPLVARLRARTAELVALAERCPNDPFSNIYMAHRTDQGVLYDLYQRCPDFVDLARHPIVVDAIANIYSPNFFLYENSLVYKPRGKANAVPWHQDFMNRPDEPLKLVAWMALDNVTEENGCMYGVPGSHKAGFLTYIRVPGETHHTRLDTTGIDIDSPVPLILSAGDVLLFHQLLIHGSREIAGGADRRAYRVSYQSFEQIFTPRGAPLVISLRDPAALTRPAVAQGSGGISVRRAFRKLRARLSRGVGG